MSTHHILITFSNVANLLLYAVNYTVQNCFMLLIDLNFDILKKLLFLYFLLKVINKSQFEKNKIDDVSLKQCAPKNLLINFRSMQNYILNLAKFRALILEVEQSQRTTQIFFNSEIKFRILPNVQIYQKFGDVH